MYISFFDPETDSNYIGEYIGTYTDTVESIWNEVISSYDLDARFCMDFSTLFTYGSQEIIYYDLARCYSSEEECYLNIYVIADYVLEHYNYLEDQFGYSDPNLIEPNMKCKFSIEVPLALPSNTKIQYGNLKFYGHINEIFNLSHPEYEKDNLNLEERYLRLCESLVKFDYPLLNVYPYEYLKNNEILNEKDNFESFEFVIIEGFIDDDISQKTEELFEYFLIPTQYYTPLSQLDLEIEYTYSDKNPDIKKWLLILKQYISPHYFKPSQFIKEKNHNKRLYNIEVSRDLSSKFEIDLVMEELIYKEEDKEYLIDSTTCGYKLDPYRFFGLFDHSLLITNDIYERLFLILLLKLSIQLEDVMYVDILKIQERILQNVERHKKSYCMVSLLKLPRSSRIGLKIESKNEYIVYTSMEQIYSQKDLSVTLDSSLDKFGLESTIKNKLNKANIYNLDSIMSSNFYIINNKS